MKVKAILTLAGFFVFVGGIFLGWSHFRSHQRSPLLSSSTAPTDEKKDLNAFFLSDSSIYTDPLLAKILNGVGEGRDISLIWGEQDSSMQDMVSPRFRPSTFSDGPSSFGPGAGNSIGSVPSPGSPGLASANNPGSNAPQGIQVVDVFPINDSRQGEGGGEVGEGRETNPVNSIPLNVDDGDEVAINFHPRSGEGDSEEGHQNKKEETVVVTLDGDQVSVKHSEKFKVSHGNGSDNEAKETHGNQDNPGHSNQKESPIEIQVSSDEKGVHVHVPKGAHQDFDVDVGVRGKNNDNSTPLDAGNSSVTLHQPNK